MKCYTFSPNRKYTLLSGQVLKTEGGGRWKVNGNFWILRYFSKDVLVSPSLEIST